MEPSVQSVVVVRFANPLGLLLDDFVDDVLDGLEGVTGEIVVLRRGCSFLDGKPLIDLRLRTPMRARVERLSFTQVGKTVICVSSLGPAHSVLNRAKSRGRDTSRAGSAEALRM